MAHAQQCKETKEKDICFKLKCEAALPRDVMTKNLIHGERLIQK